MATETPVAGGFEAGLRSSLRGLIANVAKEGIEDFPAESVAEPGSTPESTPETPAEPAPSAPATDGGTPPVAPEPAQAKPVESPSPDQPPASDAPKESAYQKLLSRYGGDPEKAAAEFFALESRHAAQVKAEKAKAQTAQPAAPAAAVPEPVPVTAKPAAIPVPTPEPPAAGQVQLPADVEEQVVQLLQKDPEIQSLSNQHVFLAAERDKIYQADQFGRPVAGQFVEVDRQIGRLQQYLLPPDEAKKLGVEIPQLDEITRAQISQKLIELKLERRDLIDKYHELNNGIGNLEVRFRARRDGYRSRYEQDHLERQAEADYQAKVDTRANEFQASWPSIEDTVFRNLSVPEELRSDIHRALVDAAVARVNRPNGAFQTGELQEFMAEVTKREIDKADKYHRLKSAEYAKAKAADAQTATPGPKGPAAVAPPSPTDHPDHEKALKARYRELRARMQGA